MKTIEVSYDPKVVQSFMDGLNVELQAQDAEMKDKVSDEQLEDSHSKRILSQFNLMGQWRKQATEMGADDEVIDHVTHSAMTNGPIKFLAFLQSSAQGRAEAMEVVAPEGDEAK